MSESVIRAIGLEKIFRLPHERQTTLKSRVVRPRRLAYEEHVALSDVSFEIERGEFFGIIGRNGSGKSTLLKILAGIYTPTSGSVEVSGRLMPFVELGVGFNGELSGRDNVFLNGALLGFDASETAAMYDQVVEFAGLERFMDQKLKNYSSGMQVRLAFSLAIRPESDILLFDEVLAVGDADFQRKCFAHFDKLRANGKTVILVTHDMNVVARYCTRTMVIDRGRVALIGESSEAAETYGALNRARRSEMQSQLGAAQHVIRDCWLTDEHGEPVTTLVAKHRYVVNLTVENQVAVADLGVTFAITSGGTALAGYSSYFDPLHKSQLAEAGLHHLRFAFTNLFKGGVFIINAAIYEYVRGADGQPQPLPLASEVGIAQFTSSADTRPAVLLDLDNVVSVATSK